MGGLPHHEDIDQDDHLLTVMMKIKRNVDDDIVTTVIVRRVAITKIEGVVDTEGLSVEKSEPTMTVANIESDDHEDRVKMDVIAADLDLSPNVNIDLAKMGDHYPCPNVMEEK